MKSNASKPAGLPAKAAPLLPTMLTANARLAVVLIFGLGVVGGFWAWLSPTSSPVAFDAGGRVSPRLMKGNHGPWGELEYIPIVLETPDEFLSAPLDALADPVWVFRDYSVSALVELFNTAGVSSQEREWLLDQRNWRPVTNGFAISPPSEMLLGINRTARERIYAALAQCGGNPLQELPLSFRGGGLDDWFYKSGLSASTIALTKSLIYQRGNVWCLSDWPSLLRLTESPGERRRLLKTTSRQATLMLHLRIRPGADVDQLAQYWGRGGRLKDIRPLMQSLTRIPEGVTLDIAHLLPRVVRSRIYTYPHPSETGEHALPSAFWTSVNFFANELPEHATHGPGELKRALAERFYPVEEDFLLGDVLLLSKPSGEPLHTAVFIADDVAVSMSAAYHIQPWMFVRMNDLAAGQPSAVPLKLLTYRRKDL